MFVLIDIDLESYFDSSGSKLIFFCRSISYGTEKNLKCTQFLLYRKTSL